MTTGESSLLSRRAFAGAAAFTILPRNVLGGSGFVAPSDKITLASIGLGRQGMVVTMSLLARPEIQVVAVCDCNQGSKDYAEYGKEALLNSERRMLGSGYEKWGEDMASPGAVQLTHTFQTSLGMGGREPAKRLVEAYYASRKDASYTGCSAYRDYRELLDKEKDLDAVYVATPDHWHAPISLAAMRKGKHVLCQKPMAHSIGEARRVAADGTRDEGRHLAACEQSVLGATPGSSRNGLRMARSGGVREVHNWSSRPYWPQGVDRPKDTQPVPVGARLGPLARSRSVAPLQQGLPPVRLARLVRLRLRLIRRHGLLQFLPGMFKILDLVPPTAGKPAPASPTRRPIPQGVDRSPGLPGPRQPSHTPPVLVRRRPAASATGRVEQAGRSPVPARRRQRGRHVCRRHRILAGRLQRQ